MRHHVLCHNSKTTIGCSMSVKSWLRLYVYSVRCKTQPIFEFWFIESYTYPYLTISIYYGCLFQHFVYKNLNNEALIFVDLGVLQVLVCWIVTVLATASNKYYTDVQHVYLKNVSGIWINIKFSELCLYEFQKR